MMTTEEPNVPSEASYLMDEMTWQEYADAVAAGAGIIIPVGSLEQHGAHLPMKTDAFIPSRFAQEVARRTGHIVAPALPYGYKSQALSGGGQIFPGTTSLAGRTLTESVRDLIGEFVRHGVRRILIISGHGENQFFLFEGADLALKSPGAEHTKIFVTGWWQHLSDGLVERLFGDDFPGWDLEHAATIETSLMLALEPMSVRTDRIKDEVIETIPPYSTFPQPPGLVPASGLLSRATPASAEIGAELADAVVSSLEAMVRAEFG